MTQVELARVLLEFFSRLSQWRDRIAVSDVAGEAGARREMHAWLLRLQGDPTARPEQGA